MQRILGPFSSHGGNLSFHPHGEPKGRRVGLGQKGSISCRLGFQQPILVRAPQLVGSPPYNFINFLKSFYHENVQRHTYTHRV